MQITRNHGSATRETDFPNTSKGDQLTLLYRSSKYERGGGNQTRQTKASNNTRGNEQYKFNEDIPTSTFANTTIATKHVDDSTSHVDDVRYETEHEDNPANSWQRQQQLQRCCWQQLSLQKLSHEDVVLITQQSRILQSQRTERNTVTT